MFAYQTVTGIDSRFKILCYLIREIKTWLNITTSQYTITHIVYFKTVIENASYIINKLVIYVIYSHTHACTNWPKPAGNVLALISNLLGICFACSEKCV